MDRKAQSERSEWVRRVANRLRRLPKSAQERSAHALPVAKASFLRDCFDGAPPLFERQPGGLQPEVLDRSCRRLPVCDAKHAIDLARPEARRFGEPFHRQRLM